ncbi:prephenate dehydrogenase [Planctomycetales bacterium ZRK34]|nr:prephenate dehydrogenase [Planctomycetales bacterium ZRK34]
MQTLDSRQITIVGTGLLGGSIGLALRAAGYDGKIIGVARKQSTRDAAVALGCVNIATADLATGVDGSDMIVLCAPVGTIPALLEQLATSADSDAVITDVGSTKLSIVEAAEKALPNPGRFVGSHPMAGSESTGAAHARTELFRNKPVIITPTDQTLDQAVDQVSALWQTLGMVTYRATPAEHDQMVAHISHLPHAMAVLLVLAAEQGGGLEVASTGFTDTTRIASGDGELWADIFLDNAGPVVEAMDQFVTLTQNLRQIIADGDRSRLLEILESARGVRDRWIKQNAKRKS